MSESENIVGASRSLQEEDHLDRSTKKVKSKDTDDRGLESLGLIDSKHNPHLSLCEGDVGNDQDMGITGDREEEMADYLPKVSFKEKLLGKDSNKGESSDHHIWFNPAMLFDLSKINIQPPEPSRPYPKISLNSEFKERLESKWRSSLILKLLGRSIGYNALLNKIQ